jgi:hypothetical protein
MKSAIEEGASRIVTHDGLVTPAHSLCLQIHPLVSDE